jgi:hypothetical protein
MKTKKTKKAPRPRSKKAQERIQEREQASIMKARALSDRFTHVVKKHIGEVGTSKCCHGTVGCSGMGEKHWCETTMGQQRLDTSEAMLALVGAGLASFAPRARFVLDEGGEPVEFTKKEVKRAGENLISDWLLGTFKKVLPPR